MSEGGIYEEPVTAFDDIEREGQEPAGHLIGHFDYLNSSGRPEAAAVRTLVDRWLADFPTSHRSKLIGKLRSRDNTLHLSSFFELMLHALLLKQGFAVVEIEQTLPNGRAPDFLVEAPCGKRFYLEAKVTSGTDNVAAGADRRMREALQAIDDVQSPDFFLHLRTRGTPTRPVAVRRLRLALQRFVDELDYEQAVRNEESGVPAAPIWRHEEHGARFTIQPVPKNVRRAGGRAVWSRMLPGGLVQPELAIRSAVKEKAGRYGEIDLPLVIAVNSLEDYAGIDDAVEALFGTTGVVVCEGFEPQELRNPDGAWRGPIGPVFTRSSAVLFVKRLTPWTVAQRLAHLIVNPWARYPIGDIPLGVEVREVTNGLLQTRTGHSLREIFDLVEGWPEPI
jgi:hypothetical protein